MNIICCIPDGCSFIAVVKMSFYALTDEKAAEIMETNRIKKGEFQ